MRISDWSSDVCSSDLLLQHLPVHSVLQEQPHTGLFTTLNWVKYQPFKDGDPDRFESEDDPYLALVLARGVIHEKLLCGLGTSHPNARVSYFGFNNNDPTVAFEGNGSPYNRWKQYGKGGREDRK